MAKCPVCASGKASVARSMVLRKNFGKIAPVRICEHCDKKVSDFEVLLSCLPMKRWRLARRMMFGARGRINERNENFSGPIGIWEITSRPIPWKKFTKNYSRFKRGGGRAIYVPKRGIEDTSNTERRF